MSTADTISLAGQVAIVTGSGRENGIGAAIALALAHNGAAVAINYVSESSASRAETVREKLEAVGARATIIQADISTPEGALKLVRGTLEAFGTDRIDILINNAGRGLAQGKLTTELLPEDLHDSFSANVFTTIFMTQAAVPHMPHGSCIVNIGTVVTKSVLGGVTAYGASKAAQDFVSSALAVELGKSKGIRVNTVAPGGTMSDAVSWFPEGELKSDVAARLGKGLLLEERAGQPEEVADAVLMMVSPLSRWVTGQHILASGGVRA